MLKHDRPVVGCVGSAVGSVVGGLLRTVDKSAQAISLQVTNDLGLPFDLSAYTIFGVSDSDNVSDTERHHRRSLFCPARLRFCVPQIEM